jgi:glycogen operon protein
LTTGARAATTTHVLEGKSNPLGAQWEGRGVNFAVFSQDASAIEICLFEQEGSDEPTRTFMLPGHSLHVWHGYVPGLKPGTRYGIRAQGEYDPEQGRRYNPAKLLVDPYARAIDGPVNWGRGAWAYVLGDPESDLAIDTEPDFSDVPKSIVIDRDFDWEGDRPPAVPWAETIIYETHVKGLTMQCPDVPEHLRGTYAGLAHPATIKYLTDLGITTVELLPVHAFVDDQFLFTKGLRNYWGYSTLGYFAPEPRYAASQTSDGSEVDEFKGMVKALHAAGLEVIMDVVYNHTCEGNHLGPTLSFRGLDNETYYRLVPGKPRYYLDFTGTGNTFDADNPDTLKLILDSLRYWATEMHIDGFRFDLATTLARGAYDVEINGPFLEAVHQDPILSQRKLIAEPWDIGENGYLVGQFPVLWSEWNDKYRDAVRAFWNAGGHPISDMGYRLTGSSDLYQAGGRGPRASINFVTAHDGFTLQDLVSYDEKHNEANGEGNQDGNDNNLSNNYGVEGPTEDEQILDLRARQQRNMLATLLFSQGTPMLLGGDEIGRSQEGNNNAYCQDNKISWYDWQLDDRAKSLHTFTKLAISIRKTQPMLRRRKFFEGVPLKHNGFKDLAWIRPDGREMEQDDWENGSIRSVGLRMAGDELEEYDEEGNELETTSLFLLIHGGEEPIDFTLPAVDRPAQDKWYLILNTDKPDGIEESTHGQGEKLSVPGRTVMLFYGGAEVEG